jgi:DtxR family transcriptional regulator, Mn-dependent transcriptional regulator
MVNVQEVCRLPSNGQLGYTSTMKLTISKEDYLKAIAEADAEGSQLVTAAALRRRLNVSAPAVTAALRRLSRDRLARTDTSDGIHLTARGREITARLLRRHYLVERMLTEIFGMEWYKVHDEAERLEHAVSDDFEQRLVDRLGTDAPCPHGHPIESVSAAERRKRGWRLLDGLAELEGGTIVAVHEEDRALLEYFDRVGLRPGARFSVVARNADRTLTLQIEGKDVTVGAQIGSLLWVSRSADLGAKRRTTRP